MEPTANAFAPLIDALAHPLVQRVLWASVAAAVTLAIVGRARRYRALVHTTTAIVFAVVLFTQPALGTFTGTNAPVAPVNAATIAAPASLSCTWTGPGTAQLSWPETATGWADNNYINRDTNGGGPTEVGNSGARTTLTYNDTGLTPESNSYAWTVKAGKNNWRGAATSSVAASTCNGNPTVSTPVRPAVTSTLTSPEAMVLDSSGNMYIADTANHCVRKVTASTGQLTSIAGLCGTSGSTGNGGAATSARLNGPRAIVLSGTNIYIADEHNDQVRVFTEGGNINTFAGTGTGGFSGDGAAATSARLDNPTGLAIDSNGYVFISDRLNQRIRVVHTDGNIYSIAGTGTLGDLGVGNPATSYRVNNPAHLALDGSNNLYWADRSNHRVRKLVCATNCGTPATWTWTSSEIAGTGSSGYSGDGGAASAAKFSSPYSITFDSSNNMYIADTTNGYIRKITAGDGVLDSGDTISTVAGTGTSAAKGDGYPALATNLNIPSGVYFSSGANAALYIADTGHSQIRKLSVRGSTANVYTVAGNGSNGATNSTAASAAIVKPQGLAIDTTTSPVSLVIADPGDHRIRRYWPDTGETATIAGTGGAGSSGDSGPAVDAKVSAPEGVAVDSSGNIFIADTGNNKIRKIDTSGNMSTYAGTGSACASACDNATGTSAKFNAPSDVVVDSSGNVYVADTSDFAIRKIATGGTNAVTTFSGLIGTSGYTEGTAANARYGSMDGLGIDASNNLYVADTTNNRIRKVDTSGTSTLFAGTTGQNTACAGVATTGITLSSPGDVVVVGNDVYIASTSQHRVCRVNAGGTSSNYMGQGSGGTGGDDGAPSAATIETPGGLAYSSTYGLFVAHTLTNGRIRRVTAPIVVS
jgi:hypothetical protein